MNADSAAAVAASLKALDRERYYASLVLPEAARGAAQSLFAFSAEIAAIRERAREAMPGEIRLQWWTDAVEGQGHGEVRQNPVADALLSTVETYGLPRPPLLRLIEARHFDLYNDPMPDVTAFEGYAGETVSVLYQLAAMILKGGEIVVASDAAGHLGVAQALAGHLRAFGYNAARGRIFLPWSVFAANGVAQEDVLAGRDSAQLVAARRQLLELAHEHAEKARSATKALPPTLRPAFASVALLGPQLRRLEMSADNPFAQPPDTADWRKLVLLAWGARFG